MTIQKNNMEQPASGTAVTTSNQTGAAEAFNTVTPGTGGTILATNADFHSGSQSWEFTPATGVACLVGRSGFSTTTLAVRFYFKLLALPGAAGEQVMAIRNTTHKVHFVAVGTTGIMTVSDLSGTNFAMSPAQTLSINTWYRYEAVVVAGATTTTGSITAAIYAGDSGTALSTYTNAAANTDTGSLPMNNWQIGWIQAVASTAGMRIDDTAHSDDATQTTFIGIESTLPVGTAGPTQPSVDRYSPVTLIASATNSPTSRAWTQSSGTTQTLSSTTVDSPTFTPTKSFASETLIFSYTATNATGTSLPVTQEVDLLPCTEGRVTGSATANPGRIVRVP